MVASKRKVQTLGLSRRVRPCREQDWEQELESDSQKSEHDVSEQDTRQHEDSADDSASDVQDEESQPESDDEAPPKVDLSSISFGALARAQESMPATNRRTTNKDPKTAPDEKKITSSRRDEDSIAARKTSKPRPKPSRSSKHAPQEQTSKKPVSRRRSDIVHDPRRKARDPRFDPLMGKVDEDKARRAYAFLDEYRDREMDELRARIQQKSGKGAAAAAAAGRCLDPADKADLRRQLLSMESRSKAARARHEADDLLRQHRAKEKELVALGKQPFYLKKSEQKRQLLTSRFAAMTDGQVDRAIERKRKKVAGKEKKELDDLVRVRDRR